MLYEFECDEGHRFDVRAPFGGAPAQAPCERCGKEGRRRFSVPTLIISYPVSFSEAQEQVQRWHEEERRNYKRPEDEEILARFRKRSNAERRKERAEAGGQGPGGPEAPASAAA